MAVDAPTTYAAGTVPPVTFDILEYVVVGNSVLPPDAVERAVQAHMGAGRSLKDVEAARAALEKVYQDAGFLSVVVSVPNQQVASGEVTLEVTEARIDKLKITGAQYNRPSLIAEQLPSLRAGQVPYFPEVQEELGALQRADLQATPLIAAGDQPDQIQVEVRIEDKPAVSGSVELNNKQTFNTKRGRLEAVASYNNLYQRGHSLGLAWQYAPWRPSDANTLTAIYGLPLGRDDRLSLSLTKSNSDTPTGTSLGGATLSRGEFYSLRWTHLLSPGAWPVTHSTWMGLNFKHSLDGTRTASGLSTEKPPLRYATVGAGYDLNIQQNTQATTGLHVSLTTSAQNWSAREVDCEGVRIDQFECKRAGASANFLVLKLGMEHNREVGAGWRIAGRFDAQLTSTPLVSGEQYSLGGTDSVRGYYDYEQVGDVGWNVQLSLKSPRWFDVQGWSMSAQVFTDRGAVQLHEALSGQVARAQMGSYGLGVQFQNNSGAVIGVDVAQPVFDTRRAADNGGFRRATGRQPRWEIRASQEF